MIDLFGRRSVSIVGNFPFSEVGYDATTKTARGKCQGPLTIVLGGKETLKTDSANYEVEATADLTRSRVSGNLKLTATFSSPSATLDATVHFAGPATFETKFPYAVAWQVPGQAEGQVKVGTRRREYFAAKGTADGRSEAVAMGVTDRMKVTVSRMEVTGKTRLRFPWLPL